MTTMGNNVRRAALVVLATTALTTLCGCYDLGLGSLLSGLSGLSGLASDWSSFPSTTLYDPTETIQSVNDYRG